MNNNYNNRIHIWFALLTTAVLLTSGCMNKESSGARTGETFFGPTATTASVSAPSSIETYSAQSYFAAVLDADGKYINTLTSPHFKYNEEGSADTIEVDAHQIGSTGVYALGASSTPETQALSLNTPVEYEIFFHFTYAGFPQNTKVHGDVKSGHHELESLGVEYEVEFFLEENGVKTGHAHENETQTIVFEIKFESTKSPITTLTPTIYIAERGGAEASSGTVFTAVASNADGEYRQAFTWTHHGDHDITIDLDGNVATHADRLTITQHVGD